MRSLVLGDVQRPGSEAAYRVGPLSCHGDSESISVSAHVVTSLKYLQPFSLEKFYVIFNWSTVKEKCCAISYRRLFNN